MEFHPDLKALWQQRHAAWWKQHYEEAVDRIGDHTGDLENPYYHGPTVGHDAYYGPLVLDDIGGEMSPDLARKCAFELLVLADLAPLAPEPSKAKGQGSGE